MREKNFTAEYKKSNAASVEGYTNNQSEQSKKEDISRLFKETLPEQSVETVDGMIVDTEPIDREFEPVGEIGPFSHSNGLKDIFIKLCEPGREIEKYVASWRALERIYTASHWLTLMDKQLTQDITEQKKSPEEIRKQRQELTAAEWLFNITSAIGTRNRLRYVSRFLEAELRSILEKGERQPIEILSLGTGSGRAVLEVLIQDEFREKNIKTKMVDIDETALQYSKIFARKTEIDQKIEGQTKNIFLYMSRLVRQRKKENLEGRQHLNPKIVEMVGLIDYLSDEVVIKLLTDIFIVLPKGGLLITANISSRIDQEFLEGVMGWKKMYYRNKDEFEELIKQAIKNSGVDIDFILENEDKDSKIEPKKHTNVYIMAVCRKK
jgi:hypothetical protein